MFLYENNNDKVLVYSLIPKKDEIDEYKRQTIEKIPRDELFYLFSQRITDENQKKELFTIGSKVHYNNYVEGQLYDFYQYSHCDEREKKVLQSYFLDKGMLLKDGNEYYYLEKNVIDNYCLDAIKLPKELVCLWYFEHNQFDCTYYDEIIKLFDLKLIKEFDKKYIDELINYGLINDVNTNNLCNNNKLKTLKKIYK